MVGGWSDKTKLIQISTLAEVLVEVAVEFGKIEQWMEYGSFMPSTGN